MGAWETLRDAAGFFLPFTDNAASTDVETWANGSLVTPSSVVGGANASGLSNDASPPRNGYDRFFRFAGTNSVSMSAPTLGLTNGAAVVSFSLWFRDVDANQMISLHEDDAESSRVYLFDSNLDVGAEAPDGVVTVGNANTDYNDSVWHFATVVIDVANDQIIHYVDGSLDKVSSVSFSGSTFDAGDSQAGYIGSFNGITNLLNGDIAGFMGHKSALTLADHQTLMAGPSAYFPPAIYRLPCTDNAATNAITESAGSGETFTLEDDGVGATDLELHLNADANNDGTGDANDASGNGHNVSWTGAASYADVDTGKAFNLDGTKYLSNGDDAADLGIGGATGVFAVAIKVVPTSVTGKQTLFKVGGATNGQHVSLTGTTVEAVLCADDSAIGVSASDAVAIGVETSITAVFDLDGLVTLYVDGVSAGTADLSGVTRASGGTDTLSIGYATQSIRFLDGVRHDDPSFYYTGTIEDVRLYLRALTAAEALSYKQTPLHTEDRSQLAGDAPFAARWTELSGDDRVTAAVTEPARTRWTAGGWFKSDQIGNKASRFLVLQAGAVYSVIAAADDGPFTNNGSRARLLIKNSSGTTIVDITTNTQIFDGNDWVFVVFGLDENGGTIRTVSLDGVVTEQAVTGTNGAGTMRGTTGNLNLGATSTGTNARDTMGAHDFRWFDVHLTDPQVAAWMLESLAAGGLDGLHVASSRSLQASLDDQLRMILY